MLNSLLKSMTPAIFSVFGFVAFGHVDGAFSQTLRLSGDESSPVALLEKYEALRPQLTNNLYHRPLYFESAEKSGTISSVIYAVVDSPFSTVSTTFRQPDQWCEVLILHLNTKYCRAASGSTDVKKLAVNMGKKTPQPLAETYSLEFSHRVLSATPGYFAVQLHANEGPLNTTNYQFQFLATPLPEGKTFMRLRYSYSYGLAGRLAMQTYLSTLGRGKVGFTKSGTSEKAGYVSGMQGAVERNTMRYYLAIEAYLASLGQPPLRQFDSRLQHWFSATEEYPLQLREVDRASYIEMKKAEYQRQKFTPPVAQ